MQGVTILATHQYPSRLTEKATNGRGTKFDSKSFLFVSVVDVTTFGCSASSGPIADHNTGFARPDSTTTQWRVILLEYIIVVIFETKRINFDNLICETVGYLLALLISWDAIVTFTFWVYLTHWLTDSLSQTRSVSIVFQWNEYRICRYHVTYHPQIKYQN